MGTALTAFFLFLIVVGGIMITLSRRTRTKMQETALGEDFVPPEKPERQLSRRQQRIVATLEPAKELPTIEELVAAEAADTGVNDIPGGDGLDVSLKLRVYWRDEVVRTGCDDGTLEFRIDEGVDPVNAETEDVRLVCVRNGVVQAMATEHETADDTEPPATEFSEDPPPPDEGEAPPPTTEDDARHVPDSAQETPDDTDLIGTSEAHIEIAGNFEEGLDVD